VVQEEARLEAEEAAKEREIERLKQLERDRIKAEARERQRYISLIPTQFLVFFIHISQFQWIFCLLVVLFVSIIDEHAAAEREAERQAREQHQAMLAAMSPVERRAYDARPRVMVRIKFLVFVSSAEF
jgi:hypothetical protein